MVLKVDASKATAAAPAAITNEGYWGIPARPIKQHLKEMALLARMAKKDERKKK